MFMEAEEPSPCFADVAVIGAGVVGAFIARELSRYDIKTVLFEAQSDVAMGTSKANSSIVHAGYDAEPGSLKALLNVQGSRMMEKVCAELDVPFKRTGSLVTAFSYEEKWTLYELMERGRINGVMGLSLLSREQVLKMEPNLSPRVKYALFAPSAGVVCPYELTIAAVENAVENGVQLKLEHEVKDISIHKTGFGISTSQGEYRCRYIINAAGLYADVLSSMIGDESYSISPRKGEYILFDKNQRGIVKSVIFQAPTRMGKGILVIPTVDGNLMIGPNAEDITDKADDATSIAGIKEIINGAVSAVPKLSMKQAITSFSGLRARPSTGDFVISPSGVHKGFINVGGIESPGLSSAPAIGAYVINILRSVGLPLKEKEGFDPYRKGIVRFRELDEKEIAEMINRDPSYGRIICRCEKVTEGEIISSIRRAAGARTLDGVKRRTRAGMGRCQGGFCTPRILEIMSRETGIPMDQITKKGGQSRILFGKTK